MPTRPRKRPNSLSSPTNSSRHPQAGPLQAVADRTRSLAEGLGRDDLERRLEATLSRMSRPGVQLMVVGEFKQGKSTLVNALLGSDLCPVDDDVATAVLTSVQYSPEPWALAHRRTGEAGTVAESFDPALAPEFVSEAGNPGNEKGLVRVEFGVPSRFLESGVILVDTPGVGGLESSHGAITLGALAEADAVVFVSDTSQELTRPELDFLRHAHDLCPVVLHAFSKIDVYPEWRRIVDLSRQHLSDAGLSGPVVGISSTLYRDAARIGDLALTDESGMRALLAELRDRVVDPGELLVLRSALADVTSCAAQLAAPLDAELAVLEDPDRASEIGLDLESAQARARDLQNQSSGWQVTLSDGIADLNSDVDHDLRARTRRLIHESEAAIDEADPADMWDEFEADLYARVTNEIVANFTLLKHQVDDLIGRVDRHFSAAENEVSQALGVAAPVGAVEGLSVASDIDLDRPGIMAQSLSGLRGSYGGVLMFSMIGNMVGLAALNPAVLVVGLLMGRKSLREEKKRQLNARRQQAKSAVRKYIDQVSFQVGKDSRDSLRMTQRGLRDHFTGRADELSRSIQAAVAAARAAARSEEQTRSSRIKELRKFLERVRAIDRQCEAIRAELGSGSADAAHRANSGTAGGAR